MNDLYRATKAGDIERMRELLATQSVAINSFDERGRTALMYAVESAGTEGVRLLLSAGASVHQESKVPYEAGRTVLSIAVSAGNPEIAACLIEAGADIAYERQTYDVLIDAVHGRDVLRDSRLLDLLSLLVASGARLNTITSYSESALRVLSRLGRFDAVRYLLEVGADESLLSWNSLIKAVALGSVTDVENEIFKGAALEVRDHWERTAWLVAIQTGEISKAELLLAKGADIRAVGRCAKPPLFYAIQWPRASQMCPHWRRNVSTTARRFRRGVRPSAAGGAGSCPRIVGIEFPGVHPVSETANHCMDRV